jgi:transketolase
VPFDEGKPNLILAKTIKGKGVSFIEDKVDWHHHTPTDDEFAVAMAELQLAEEKWQVQYGHG